MVKIKTEKKMNLAELIQYITENEVRDKHYFTTASNACIEVSKNGFINFLNTFKPDDVFETVVEEEITKHSEIPNLVELYDLETGNGPETLIHQNALVNNFIENEAVIALYAMNDDYTLTLLWTKEGGMVE